MKTEDLYHTGIAVDDVDTTLHWLTEVAGCRWCDQVAVEPSRPHARRRETVRVHHLGYWSDDVDRDVVRFAAHGSSLATRLVRRVFNRMSPEHEVAGQEQELDPEMFEPDVWDGEATESAPESEYPNDDDGDIE